MIKNRLKALNLYYRNFVAANMQTNAKAVPCMDDSRNSKIFYITMEHDISINSEIEKDLENGSDQHNSYKFSTVFPPYFIVFTTVIQLAFFVYYLIVTNGFNSINPTIKNNSFIYDSQKPNDFWRIFTYMFVHFEWGHLITNLLGQLITGIPLEKAHGHFRTSVIYISSIIGGSIGASIWEKVQFKMLGSSSAVYGLSFAHLSNLILVNNF
ncbi:unnamed protein product [Gordionus sp. m RMFG-2023]